MPYTIRCGKISAIFTTLLRTVSPIPIWRKSQKTDFDQKNGSISSNPATIKLFILDLYFLFRAWTRRHNITCYILFDAEKSGLSLEPFSDICHLSRFGENCENNRFQAKGSPLHPLLQAWAKLEAAPPPPSSLGEPPSSWSQASLLPLHLPKISGMNSGQNFWASGSSS